MYYNQCWKIADMEYKIRMADAVLANMLEAMGAVLIEGPKWCGKTTTAMQHAKSTVKLDVAEGGNSVLHLARTSPERLLRGSIPRLIDEWQIVPALWDAVRYEVDKREEEGLFILTGSATHLEENMPHHSGTGRIGRLRMDPMSLFESGDSSGSVSIQELFRGNCEMDGESSMDIDKLAFLCSRGGWPRVCRGKMKASSALIAAKEYVKSIEHSEINTPEGKTVNTHLMRIFLHSYARNVGSQCPVSEIIKDCIGSMNTELGENTAYSYLKRLKDLFVVDEAGFWNPNLRSKTAIRTSPTRYFCDPSIAVASLGASPDDLIDDMRTFGFIFENLCMRDLRVYSRFLDGEVLHYRDGNNLECDAVIHLPNGKYALIEIKIGGEQAIEHGAATLKKLASLIDVGKMRAPSFLMVLTGLTKYPYRRDDGVFVVPVDCLKP